MKQDKYPKANTALESLSELKPDIDDIYPEKKFCSLGFSDKFYLDQDWFHLMLYIVV